jgi:hypothetical protein
MFRDSRGVVPLEKRKIIYCGTDIPSVKASGPEIPKAESLVGNLDRLRTMPFGGLSVQMLDGRFPWPQNVVGHNLFSTTRYDYNFLKPTIAPMKTLKEVPNLTDNFLLIACNYWFESGVKNGLDLFSDARWKTILDNVSVYARVARDAGTIRGFILDIEPYSGPAPTPGGEQEWAFNIFSFDHMTRFVNKLEGHPNPMAAYRGQANKRGKQIWEAIERNMPGAILFLYFGNWWADQKADKSRADLFPPFLDGVMEQMEAMGSKGYVVDGYEPAYTFHTEQEYRDARQKIREYLRGYSAVTALYDKYVRVGFGKWLDAGSRWVKDDASQNHFKPGDWESSLRYALKYADEYVWVWAGGQARFFTMSGGREVNIPPAYINASRRANGAPTPPASKPSAKPASKPPTKKSSAKKP